MSIFILNNILKKLLYSISTIIFDLVLALAFFLNWYYKFFINKAKT